MRPERTEIELATSAVLLVLAVGFPIVVTVMLALTPLLARPAAIFAWKVALSAALRLDVSVEVISKELNLKLETPFLLYKNARGHINGIWFHLKEECEDVNKIIEGIIREIKESDYNKNRGKVEMDRHRPHPVIEVNHTEFLPENISKSEGVLLRLDELFKKADTEHRKISSKLETELLGLNPEGFESDPSLDED